MKPINWEKIYDKTIIKAKKEKIDFDNIDIIEAGEDRMTGNISITFKEVK